MDVNLPDIDLDLVRCFLVVAESGGFTAASHRLHLSQSAVSLKIQRLEALLERSVFHRTSRSLDLTPEGEVLLGYARRLLALNQEMILRVAQPTIEGVVRLGVVQQFGQEFLPGLLSQFKSAHPRVRLQVEVGMSADLLMGMEQDRFDLVLAGAGFRPSSAAQAAAFTEERVLLREALVWVQAESSRMDVSRDPVPLALFAAPCGFRRIAFDVLEKAGKPWEIVYSSTSLASILSAVQADLGVGVFGLSAVGPGLWVIPPGTGLPALPETAIAIYSRKSAKQELAGSLSDFMAGAVARWHDALPLSRKSPGTKASRKRPSEAKITSPSI